MRAVVIGGGLAGITAALKLADSGAEVTLHESKPKLGGLTHSWGRDLPTIGERIDVDNGQHVFLRCCTSYLSLLERLGVRNKVTLQDRLNVIVRSEESSKVGRLRRYEITPPYHLGGSLLKYPFLSLKEKSRLLPAILAMKDVDRNALATDRRSFGRWLAEHGQSPRAVEAVWDLIGIATLNARAEDASLALAATVFQLGLLDEPGAADIGWSVVPLQELHGDAAMTALTAAGVDVRVSSRVRSLDEVDEFDVVVIATPAEEAETLLPPTSVAQKPGWSARLGASPIVNLHVIYDREVMNESFVATVDSPLQWVFDRTGHSGLSRVRPGSQYIAVSLSAADDLVDVPVAELRERFLPHLAQLLPRAAEAEVLEFFVTREREATFRPAPGSGADRPETRCLSENVDSTEIRTTRRSVYLAGAWTATGWPATMEGAVRSGEVAAEMALSDHAIEVHSQ